MNDDDEVRGWRAAAKVAGRSVAGMQKLAAADKLTVGGDGDGAVFSRTELLGLPPVVRLVEPVGEAAPSEPGDLTAAEAAPVRDGRAAELPMAGAGKHASQPSTGAIPAPGSSPVLHASASPGGSPLQTPAAGPPSTDREGLAALHVQRLRLDLLETRLGWRETEITRLLQDRRDDRKRIAALERELSRRPLVR